MKCRHVCNLASQYLSGELPPEKMAAIEAHAAECSSCRAEVAATERALRALERPKPLFEPPDVLEAVKMQVARPSRSFGTGRVGWAFAGAAAIVLAAWLAASLSPARHAPPASPGVMESQAPNTPIARETAKPMPNPVAAGTAPANARDDAKASRPQRAPDKIRKPEGRSISHPKPEPIRAAPEPTIEYVVVYTPEPPEPEAAFG